MLALSTCVIIASGPVFCTSAAAFVTTSEIVEQAWIRHTYLAMGRLDCRKELHLRFELGSSVTKNAARKTWCVSTYFQAAAERVSTTFESSSLRPSNFPVVVGYVEVSSA